MSSMDPREERRRDREIKRIFEKDSVRESQTHKILVVDLSMLKRSSLFDDLDIKHGNEIDAAEKRELVPQIHNSIVSTMQNVLRKNIAILNSEISLNPVEDSKMQADSRTRRGASKHSSKHKSRGKNQASKQSEKKVSSNRIKSENSRAQNVSVHIQPANVQISSSPSPTSPLSTDSASPASNLQLQSQSPRNRSNSSREESKSHSNHSKGNQQPLIRKHEILQTAFEIADFEIDSKLEESQKTVMAQSSLYTRMSASVAQALELLWSAPGIRKTYEFNQWMYPVYGSYFFDRIQQISSDNWIPTKEDLANWKSMTTGVIETVIDTPDYPLRFIRLSPLALQGEKKKWIHSFSKVIAVVFIVNLSEYKNRFFEQMELVEDICNLKWFKNSSMILWLDRMDEFEQAISSVPLCTFFPEFTGSPTEVRENWQFISTQFSECKDDRKKKIYSSAGGNDDHRFTFLFSSIRDVIILNSVKKAMSATV